MNRTVHILERARADVDAIFNWLVGRSLQGAVSWYLAFHQAIDRIASAAESYGEAPEAHPLNRQLRQAPFKTRRGRVYRIVFEIVENDILVLRVRGPGQAPLRRQDVPTE
jgi:plasmid stabilization system protein ParE